jgi:ABC-type bacteriocin/lantibiotic exporter with double-glycine peptidase domain
VLLSNITHQQQRRESDCLISCSQMVLAYLGIPCTYEWLSKTLETTAIGTPFFHVEKLGEALGVVVATGVHATLAQFEPLLESGLPVLATVDSDAAQYWPHYANHVVVIVGFNDHEVYVHNPALDKAPQIIEMNTFLWAWSRRDYEYAVIRLT